MFRKIPCGRIFLHFFQGSESDRVFNYLHDSNSIFRAAGNQFRRGFPLHGGQYLGFRILVFGPVVMDV